MVFPINVFTIPNLIGFMITASLAAMFYIVYLKAGRRRMDLIAANFILGAGGASLVSFLTDNLVPAGMSSWGWPGGPTAEALKLSTLEIHRLVWVIGVLGLPTQLHFILHYCQKQNLLRRYIWVIYTLAVLLVPTVWTPLWVQAPDAPLAETSSWRSTIPWLPNMGVAAYAFLLCTISVQTYGLVQLWKTKRLSVSDFSESLGERRIVFAALMAQMVAALGDMCTSALNTPMPALAPFGAGIMGILLSVALIRSRVATDRARHQLQAEKAAMLECVPQPFFYFARDSRLQWANNTAAAFAGRKHDELVGRGLDEIIGTSKKERPTIEASWQQGRQVTGEIVRDDDSTWIVNASPVLGATGQPQGAVVLATDITEIRLAQEALRDSNIKILAAREEECRRVARDLHDSVAQGLTALQMHLCAGAAKAQPHTPEQKQLEFASKRCADLGKEVRQISHQLYPPALDLLGLSAALDEVLIPYRSAGIECVVESSQDARNVRLSQDAEVALYRVAQEAINNAVRHGGAKKIDVLLEQVGEEFVLNVTDNGSGFDVAKKGLGLGMTSMKSRITGVGGKLEFASRPGQTRVTACVVLPKAAEGSDVAKEPSGLQAARDLTPVTAT